MRYQNEPCCGCGTALEPQTDNVVVCPDCGAPMHRACWDLEAACPLRAQHGPDFRWKATIPPEPAPPAFDPKTQLGIICPHCGGNCPPASERCRDCGEEFGEAERFTLAREEQMQREAQQHEEYFREHFPHYQVNGRELRIGDPLSGQPMEDIVLQVRGSNRTVTRYLTRFENNRPLGWNWAAFLFTPYWFFFRKLYRPGLLFAGLLLAISLAFPSVSIAQGKRLEPHMDAFYSAAEAGDMEAVMQGMNSYFAEARAIFRDYRWQLSVQYGLLLLLHIAAGLIADRLLRRQIFANIQAANEGGNLGPPQRRHQLLIRMGGISFLAPMLYTMADRFIIMLISSLIS